MLPRGKRIADEQFQGHLLNRDDRPVVPELFLEIRVLKQLQSHVRQTQSPRLKVTSHQGRRSLFEVFVGPDSLAQVGFQSLGLGGPLVPSGVQFRFVVASLHLHPFGIRVFDGTEELLAGQVKTTTRGGASCGGSRGKA